MYLATKSRLITSPLCHVLKCSDGTSDGDVANVLIMHQ